MSLVNSRNIPLTDNEKFEALQAKSGMTTTVLPTAVEENFSQYSSTGGVTPLMQACQQGHESSVRQLLHKDSRIVLERDRTGKTALHYCAENSSLTCIDQILSVDPSLLSARDEDGYTPLHLATIAGNRSVVRYLLSKGTDVHATDNEKHTAVHWATVCGEVDLLELLIESGGNPSTPDIHGAYPIHYAAQMCGPNSELGQDVQTGLLVLQKLLQKGVDVSVKDQDGRQPLLWAASAEVRPSHVYCPSGSADAILALVNAGADVTADDKDGLTALHCAASRGHVDCLDVLISLCSAEVDTLDGNGCTPLFYAATLGHADCTELLLKHGSIPDRQDRKGRTPAHCGAAKGQLETLKLLHKRGADLWKRNVKGDLPLHEAIQSGRKDLVMWLLSLQPTSVNAPNNDGRCPLHIAAINNNTEMCKIIMDYKAAVNPIMRNSRGQLLTPVDAAVARGNKGCAKYLQLHGGLPAIRLTDKRALQAAMQRALEFEPTGHTGATPSDLTGELTESSSPTMSKAPFFLEIPPSALLTPKDGISDGHVSSATIGLQMGYPYDQIDSGSQTEGGTPGFQGPEMFTSDTYIKDLILNEEQMMMTAKMELLENGKLFGLERGETTATIENHKIESQSSVQETDQEESFDSSSTGATKSLVSSVSKSMSAESETLKSETHEKDSVASSRKKVDQKESQMKKEQSKDQNNLPDLRNGSDSEEKNSENITSEAHAQAGSEEESNKESSESRSNQTDNEKEEQLKVIKNDVEPESNKEISEGNETVPKGIQINEIVPKEIQINDVVPKEIQISAENDDPHKASNAYTVNDKEPISMDHKQETVTEKKKVSKEKRHAVKKETKQEDKETSKKSELDAKNAINLANAKHKGGKTSAVKKSNTVETSQETFSEKKSSQKEMVASIETSQTTIQPKMSMNKINSDSLSEDGVLTDDVSDGTTRNKENEVDVTLTTPPRELGDGASEDGETIATTEDKLINKGTRTKVLKRKPSSKIPNGISKPAQSTGEADISSNESITSPGHTNVEESEVDPSIAFDNEIPDSSSHSSVETVLPLRKEGLKRTEVSEMKHEKTHELRLLTSSRDDKVGLVQDSPACISTITAPKFSKKTISITEKRSKKVISAQPENDSSENSDVDVSKGKVKTRRKTKRSMRSARNNESSKQQSDDSSYETSNENMQEGMSTKTVKKGLKGSRKGVTINKEKERLLGDLNHDAENENRDKEVADDEDMENGEAMDEIGGLEKAIIESKKDGEARIDGKEKDEATEDVKENDEGTKEVRENSMVSMKGTDIDEVTKEGRGNKAKMKDQRKKTPTKKGKNVKISVNDKEILELKEDIREAGRRVMSGGPRKVESIDSNMKKKRSGQNLPMDMSVTRAMQTTVRKYALERRLFQQLLDLKRMQIRNSRANEHMLIKRMIDEYGKDDMIGLKSYAGSYSFSNYEKYLYDQLRTLQATDTTKIPHFKSNEDVEKLTKALRKANVPDLNEPIDDLINREKDVNSCNQSTHRCHHAIHAYTGVPCAAYLAQYRKNEQRNKGSLPQVAGAGTSKVAGVTIFESKKNDIGMARSTYDPKKPLTVQLQPTKAPRLQGIKPRAEPRKGIKKNLKISDVGPTSVHAAPESKKVITQKVDEGSPSVSSAPELNKDFMQKVEDGPTSVRSAPELNKDIIQKLDDGSTSFRSEPELNKDFTQKRNDDSTSVHSSTELDRSAAHNGDEGSPDSSSLDNKDGSLQKVGEVLSETFDASDFRAINDSTSSVPLPQDPESTSNPKSPTTPITLQEQTSILKKSPQKS